MSQNNLISIIIATYEMYGKGKNFLIQAFESIEFQTYKNIEVVVSDHSINDEIKKVCLDYSKKLNIKYIKNENNIGSSSANFNNGIKYSNGNIIKILMQDDFLYKNHTISDIVNTFNHDANIYWIANGCVYGENSFSIKEKISLNSKQFKQHLIKQFTTT
jgi:glycosyltransferase involved in cell wall biosynthesis